MCLDIHDVMKKYYRLSGLDQKKYRDEVVKISLDSKAIIAGVTQTLDYNPSEENLIASIDVLVGVSDLDKILKDFDNSIGEFSQYSKNKNIGYVLAEAYIKSFPEKKYNLFEMKNIGCVSAIFFNIIDDLDGRGIYIHLKDYLKNEKT